MVIFVVIIAVLLINLARGRTLLRVGSLGDNARRAGFGFVVSVELTYIVHVHLVEKLLILPIFRLILVKFHSCHLLLQLGLLLRICFGFLLGHLLVCGFFGELLLISFLLRLDNPELIKDVLVVKNCVRKLILEVLLIEQFLDPLVDDRVFQNLVDVWPLVGILVKHRLEEVVDGAAEVAWNVWIFA